MPFQACNRTPEPPQKQQKTGSRSGASASFDDRAFAHRRRPVDDDEEDSDEQ